MRNLKRALSLALASVMLLGMMVVGTSAASYPDVDENDNVEAIEVLNAVQVMIGRQGNFEPDEAVNRHEMAVIMAKLVLGVETADNYVGSHPFTDVVPWADKYVAACYENGLVSGTSATTFSGNQPLTAVQAAAMMLRALGYKDLNKGYQGDWRAPITAKANEIRLFSGVAANPNEKLNRNQVAQLALNTLKSPMVTLIDGTFTATGENGQLILTGGAREYKTIVSGDAYAKAISEVEGGSNAASSLSGFAVELGEHLYNGKLRLDNNDIDAFGRPARTWEYDGKTIGTYAKTELLDKEYVGKVTGKDLYDLLGSSTIKNYDLLVEIDGVEQDANAFRALMDKNNKAGVGATGTGVVTEVYTDSTGRGTIYIAIINTYLAQASRDYDAKKEELVVTVYGVNGGTGDYVKNAGSTGTKRTNVKLDLEDFPIVKDMKKDDFMLVNVAGDEVVIVSSVEALESVQVSSFKKGSNVTVNGQKYDFASAAYYDNAALSAYTGNNGTVNLKDTTYNIYLDEYDNLIGIKEVEAKKNYVFIAGIDSDGSNIANKTGKARALFLDGTSDVIDYNAEKSSSFAPPLALVNTWCTYTKNSADVYTLTEVASTGNSTTKVPANIPQPNVTGAANTTKLAQFHETTAAPADKTIDKQHITLAGGGATTYSVVYGNKDTVYLTAKLANVTNGPTYGVINGVENVTVGAEKANLLAWDTAEAAIKYKTTPAAGNYASGVYTLYNNDGVVIAAVVVGEDSGAAKNFVYAHTDGLEQEGYGNSDDTRAPSDEWDWSRKVIKDGEEVMLYEKGDASSYLEKMVKGRWYQVKLNTAGNVIDADRVGTAVSGDKDFTLDQVNLTTGKTRFVDDNTQINATVGTAGVDTVLYSQRFTSAADGTSITHSGLTLFVTTANGSGFLVHEDAKIILQQYDRATQETYLTEYTAGELDSLVNEMNTRNITTFEYQVNAVIETGRATSVVINSNVSDWKPGTTTPTGKDSLPSNGVTLIVDKTVKASNFAATIAANGALTFRFDTDMGAINTATFTYDYVLKNADGVTVDKKTGETTAAATAAELADAFGANALVQDGKAYTLEITNVVPSAYKLTKDSKVADLAADDVIVTPASAMPSTGSNNLNLSIAANKLVAPEKVTIRFSVTGLDLSDVVLGTGVTGSNGTYDLTVLKSTLASGVDVLKNVKANGAVKFTVESVTDASSKVAVQVKVDAASQKYVDTLNSTIAALNLTDNQVSLANIGLTLKGVVTGWKYSVKVDGKNAVALTDNSSTAINDQTTVPVENLTVGKPVVIEVHIEPIEFTVPAAQFRITGAGTAQATKFDGNGNIVTTSNPKFVDGAGSGSEIFQVTLDSSAPEYVTAASGHLNVPNGSKMHVDVSKILDGSDIVIDLLQVRKITIDGADPIYWDIRKPYTVPTGTNGTGASVAVGAGDASYVKYGGTVAAADTAVVITTGYVKVTVTNNDSLASGTDYTAIPGLLAGSVKGLAAGNSVTITNGKNTFNIVVTVTETDGGAAVASGTIYKSSAVDADHLGTLSVPVGNKDITIVFSKAT